MGAEPLGRATRPGGGLGGVMAGRRPTGPPNQDKEPARGHGAGRVRTRADERARTAQATTLLLWCVAGLTILGLVMVLSASSVAANRNGDSSYYYFWRQLAGAAMGLACGFVAARCDNATWYRLAPVAFVGSIFMLAAVFVPSIGVEVNASRRWLGSPDFRVQPSELAKLALAMWAARVGVERIANARSTTQLVAPVLGAGVVVAALVYWEPDLGTTMILGVITFTVVVCMGTPLRALAVLAGAAIAVGIAASLAAPYRRIRLLSFLDPEKDPHGAGYQVLQSLYALGGGGVTGVGVGASRQKWSFLPNAHNDFVFAVIGEELGLVGTLVVVALFGGIAIAGGRIAATASDAFSRLLAIGITTWFVAQAFFNMGTVVGLLPVTGVPLPFVSYGLSNLVVSLVAVGVLVSIARTTTRPREVATVHQLARRAGRRAF